MSSVPGLILSWSPQLGPSIHITPTSNGRGTTTALGHNSSRHITSPQQLQPHPLYPSSSSLLHSRFIKAQKCMLGILNPRYQCRATSGSNHGAKQDDDTPDNNSIGSSSPPPSQPPTPPIHPPFSYSSILYSDQPPTYETYKSMKARVSIPSFIGREYEKQLGSDELNESLQPSSLDRHRYILNPDEQFGALFTWDGVVNNARDFEWTVWVRLAVEMVLHAAHPTAKAIDGVQSDGVIENIDWNDSSIQALKQKVEELLDPDWLLWTEEKVPEQVIDRLLKGWILQLARWRKNYLLQQQQQQQQQLDRQNQNTIVVEDHLGEDNIAWRDLRYWLIRRSEIRNDVATAFVFQIDASFLNWINALQKYGVRCGLLCSQESRTFIQHHIQNARIVVTDTKTKKRDPLLHDYDNINTYKAVTDITDTTDAVIDTTTDKNRKKKNAKVNGVSTHNLFKSFHGIISSEDELETREQSILFLCMKLHRPPNQCVIFCGDHLEDVRAAREVSAKVVARCGTQILPLLPNIGTEAQTEAPDPDEQGRLNSSSPSPSTSLLSTFGNFGRKPYDLKNADAVLSDGSYDVLSVYDMRKWFNIGKKHNEQQLDTDWLRSQQ